MSLVHMEMATVVLLLWQKPREKPPRNSCCLPFPTEPLAWRRAEVFPARLCGMDGWRWAKCWSSVLGHGGTGRARVQSREAELSVGTWQEGL